jgi:peptidase M48-like protein
MPLDFDRYERSMDCCRPVQDEQPLQVMKARKLAIHLTSLFGLALGSLIILGCASQSPITRPPIYNPPLAVRAPGTVLYLGLEALAGPIRVNRPDFVATDSESIKSASPTTDGSRYLQAAVALDPQFAQWIAVHGIPDAIAPVPGKERQYIVFYLNPPRSYAIQKGAVVASLDDVPRSVRRITFGEKPMVPPWPVTIPQASATAFGVPLVPPPPPRRLDWAAHAEDTRKVRALLIRVNGPQATRANEILQRLMAVENTQNIKWTVEVFSEYRPLGFAVPDGSLFISDKLMQDTTDTELAAAIAHLMAHVRYGHYILVPLEVVKKNVAPMETTAKSETPGNKSAASVEAEKKKPNKAAVVALTALADTLIIAWDLLWIVGGLAGRAPGSVGPAGAMPPKEIIISPVGTESVEKWLEAKRESPQPSPKSIPKSTRENMWLPTLAARQRDIEANYLAAKYLAGINVPPDALFEMLMGLPLNPPFSLRGRVQSEKTAFDEMYGADNNGAFDFGKMLDAALSRRPPRPVRRKLERQGKPFRHRAHLADSARKLASSVPYRDRKSCSYALGRVINPGATGQAGKYPSAGSP